MKTCPKCSGTFPSNFSVCPQDATPLRQASELGEGAILRGKYQILARIGEGGMGVVYKARHMRFEEICALKMVSAHLAADEEFLRRFHSEAVLMRRLEHPNALRVHDIDETEDGRPFIVMEYFEGRSLDRLVREEGPLEIGRACRIIAQACGALEAAHRLGIVHRDIKPSNLLVARTADGSEVAKVFDFGIAKVRDTSELHKGVSLTRTGLLVGTPAYMSPEQAQGARGDQLDGRSDLYSLGIVLFEILTGRLPFEEQTPASLLVAHLQTLPPDPRDFRADLPAPLGAIILRALEKDPALRFATAAEMQAALETFAGTTTSTATLSSSAQAPPRQAMTQPHTPVPHRPTPAPQAEAPTTRMVTPRPAPPPAVAPAIPEKDEATEHARTRSLLAKLGLGLAGVILLSAIAIFIATRPAGEPSTQTPPQTQTQQPAKQTQSPANEERKVPDLRQQSTQMRASAQTPSTEPQGDPAPSAASPTQQTPAEPARPAAPMPSAPAPTRNNTPPVNEVPGTVELSGYLGAITASKDGAEETAMAPPGFVDDRDFDPEDAPSGMQLVHARHRFVAGAEVIQLVVRRDTQVFSLFMAPPNVPMGIGPFQIVPVNVGGYNIRKIENPGYSGYVVPMGGSRVLVVGKYISPQTMAAIIKAMFAEE